MVYGFGILCMIIQIQKGNFTGSEELKRIKNALGPLDITFANLCFMS